MVARSREVPCPRRSAALGHPARSGMPDTGGWIPPCMGVVSHGVSCSCLPDSQGHLPKVAASVAWAHGFLAC